MERKELYICVTLYHLYISLLLIDRHQSKERSVLLLNANDAQIYAQFCGLKPMLEKHGYRVDTRLRSKIKDMMGLEAIGNRKQYKKTEEMFGEKIRGAYVLYNFAWNLQYVYTTANLFFRKCGEAYLMEEGALTAINPPQSNFKVALKKCTGTVVNFQGEPKLKGICVQKPDIYPKAWAPKLRVLDVADLASSIKPETRDVIARIFLGDRFAELKSQVTEDMGILYTQPLSEDGYISEEQKIDYYHQMARYYARYGKPIVKLHPRDLTDYHFAGELTVLPAYFPSELLNLMGVRFRYAVGICTSAVPTTDAEYRLNLNENFLKDLKFELKELNAERA